MRLANGSPPGTGTWVTNRIGVSTVPAARAVAAASGGPAGTGMAEAAAGGAAPVAVEVAVFPGPPGWQAASANSRQANGPADHRRDGSRTRIRGLAGEQGRGSRHYGLAGSLGHSTGHEPVSPVAVPPYPSRTWTAGFRHAMDAGRSAGPALPAFHAQ